VTQASPVAVNGKRGMEAVREREGLGRLGHILHRPRSVYLSLEHRGRIEEVLRNWPVKDVRVIYATSGDRLLGLGDPPQYVLPIHIDCGTTTAQLLDDPLYLGLRQPRVSPEEVDAFADELVDAVQELFPGCCIHFEDWDGVDAVRLLARYRHRVCCCSDDIQGTAGVTLGGLFSALRITGGKLSDQRILILGAGSAAIGMAEMVASAMTLEGPTLNQARRRITLFDNKGLIESGRTDLDDFQKPYAHPHAPSRDLLSVVEALRPTAIMGVSTKGKATTREVIEVMARLNPRPIILALSTPADHAECTAEEAYQWSEGRTLYAAGVPNTCILQAVGLAIYASKAKRVTDEMFIVAARVVADQLTQAELDMGRLYPPQNENRATAVAAAERVAHLVFARGLAGVGRPDDLHRFIQAQLHHRSLIP
jgi:malate dehydrogenase (oxaloacetate-decarboxylating)(NADP+)